MKASPVFKTLFNTGASRQLIIDDVETRLREEVHALVRLAVVLLQGLDLDAVEVVVVLRRGPVQDRRHVVTMLRFGVGSGQQNDGGQTDQEPELVHCAKFSGI